MKTKTIILIVVSLIPLTAFSQPQPPTPPAPPNPPMGPQPPHDREDRRPKVPVTYLGVETSEVPNVLCDQLGLPKGFGLVVDYVVPDGPAATAGVQQNDVLKMLNDQILTDPGQLSKLIRSYSEGTNVTLTVLRKGQEQKITVKLVKKEVPRRRAWMGNMQHMNHDWNFDFGDLGNLGDLKEQMSELKERLGDEQRGMIHDAVVRAREEARRATDEARRSIRSITRNNGALERTTIDLNKAQIVLSDDKGELRIENKDGKKFLTAKDPQGKLLFSGPVETNEELDKAPAEVRQRYEKLQQHDLPAVAPDDLRAESNSDDEEDDIDDESSSASNASYDQVCSQEVGRAAWEIHTVLI
jgi:hypothetical protein